MIKKLAQAILVFSLLSNIYAEDSDPYDYDFTPDNRFKTLVPEEEDRTVIGPTPSTSRAVIGPTSPSSRSRAVIGPTSPSSPSRAVIGPTSPSSPSRAVIGPTSPSPTPRTVIGPSSPPSTKTDSGNEQVAALIAQRSLIFKSMGVLATNATTLRNSISLTLQTSDAAPNSINCFTKNYSAQLKGRCETLVSFKNEYEKLQDQIGKVENLIYELSPNTFFTKIGIDTSGLSQDNILKGTADIFATDKKAPDCTLPSLAGWKCLTTKITVYDGDTYTALIKWNRPNIKSKATLFLGLGGDGNYEPINDPLQRTLFSQLNEIDEIRTVSLQLIDPMPEGAFQSGYWIYGGGYDRLAQIFMAGYSEIIKNNLMQGNFTNYYGGSNGSMMLASAMARYHADAFFDRIVFQAGPFLPSLKNACDKNSKSSFFRSTPEQSAFTIKSVSFWSFINPDKHDLCDPTIEDNISILKPGYRTDYSNTHLHVIMGAKEVTEYFGHWILNSNEEWYNQIKAKSKERIVRSYVGHDTSYEDTRRFLKLAPYEMPDRTLDKCVVTQLTNPTRTKSCGCGTIKDADLKPDGCFYYPKEELKGATCNQGTFLVNGQTFEFSCGCGEIEGGVLQKDGCYHRAKR